MRQDLKNYFNDNPAFFLIFVGAIGGLFLLASILNWEWFFGNSRLAILEKKIGRKGLRIMYGMAGVLALTAGVYAVINGGAI